MLLTFLQHQWVSFWRARGKGGSIAVKIVMGFLILYLLICAALAGIFMGKIISELLPDKNVISVFNGFILYYFALEFLVRLQMQELPTLAIVPYLHLNIPKDKLVNFLNFRAIFSAFNIIPIFVFFPFCIINIGSTYGILVSLMYMISIFSLSIFNNYLALYVKRLSITNLKFVFVGLVLLIGFGLLEYFKIFSIAEVSNVVFTKIAAYPFLAFVFPIVAVLIYKVNASYLKRNLYIEELSSGEEKKSSTDYPFLDRFGAVGTLAAVEIKLIMRNKRSKSTVSKGLIFLFYGLLLYRKQVLDKDEFGMVLFAAVFMTGNMILLYGQFMFGWQSAEFDGLLVNKLSVKNFIKAKFLLFTLSSTVLVILVSFYGFMSWKILLVQFAAYLYSVGVASVLVLYFATRNYKYLDLSKASSFNFQGVGASAWIMSLPVMLLPFAIYFPFRYLVNPYWGLAALAIFGLAGCLTRSFWVEFLVAQFNKRKYRIAGGFRER